MIKKDYQKPSMEVVNIQYSQMLCNSPAVNNVSSDDGIGWNSDGFSDDEGDY